MSRALDHAWDLLKAKDCPKCKDGKLDKAGMCKKMGCA